MTSLWCISGHEAKDRDRASRSWVFACAPSCDAGEVVKRFAKRHPDVTVTGVQFRGEYEELKP